MGLAAIRERSLQKTQRRSVISTKAWRCFMVSITGAIRSFQEAAWRDPQCAMAHWGVALAAGPHINYPLVPPPMAELA
jgi:hypothetical protein